MAGISTRPVAETDPHPHATPAPWKIMTTGQKVKGERSNNVNSEPENEKILPKAKCY